MSKRKRRDRSDAVTATKPRQTSSAVTAPSPTAAATLPTADASATWRWVIFGVAVLVLLAGWGVFTLITLGIWPFNAPEPPVTKPGDHWRPPAWNAQSEEDRFIERYVQLRAKNDPAAAGLLTDLAAGDEPIDEDEFERRAAGHFLRDKELKIVEVWKGEPGKDGKPVPAAGRYILVTEGRPQTPHMTVRDSAGKPSPTALSMFNPDIVVEVKGGKVQPLRTELHKAP